MTVTVGEGVAGGGHALDPMGGSAPPFLGGDYDYQYIDPDLLKSMFLNMSQDIFSGGGVAGGGDGEGGGVLIPMNESYWSDYSEYFNSSDFIDKMVGLPVHMVAVPSNGQKEGAGPGGFFGPSPTSRLWADLNETEKDHYLEQVHGPRHLDKKLAIPMTVFYLVLFFAGIPGNLLTCLIILWNSYMRAPPNFFLFNLAIADIITLIIGKKTQDRKWLH